MVLCWVTQGFGGRTGCHGAFHFLLPWRDFSSHFLDTEMLTLPLLTAGSSGSVLLYDIFKAQTKPESAVTHFTQPQTRFCLAHTKVLHVKGIAIWSCFVTALCFLLCMQIWRSPFRGTSTKWWLGSIFHGVVVFSALLMASCIIDE